MSVLYTIKGRKYYYLMSDIIIVISSYLFSYVIRFYPDLYLYKEFITIKYIIPLLLAYIFSYYLFQIYRIMWTYSNINDIYKLMFANITGFFIFVCYIFSLHLSYSRIVLILLFMFSSFGSIFYKILIRDYYSKKRSYEKNKNGIHYNENSAERGKNILIAGAGEAGRIILSEYNRMGLGKSIVGFVDDNMHKVGKIFNGKMIYNTIDKINDIINELRINEIIIAMPSVGSENINRIVTIVKRENPTISIKTLPFLTELYNDKMLLNTLREITIADLIGREEFTVDNEVIKNRFSDKTVLVTGAGGSIGSEICRQLLKYKIKKLIAVGRGEFSIFNLIKMLNSYIEFMDQKPVIVYKIADVKDYKMMQIIIKEQKPDIIFHAAAHKHVPLMEYNEVEAIQNNVMGTKNVLDLASKYDIKEFVLISTDKAVHPVNIMGATKRMAEVITNYYNKEKGLKTTIVRFGNVIGSRGSVIPLFKEQIKKGGPVTVTHPDITRYFMSIPEASLLVINAAAYSNAGDLFVLDMGKQYKILDIAHRLIEFYGYKPDEDIKIEFTGLRPGEKMYEELFYKEENLIITDNKKIFVLNTNDEDYDKERIEYFINNELPNIIRNNPNQVRNIIKGLIPEYEFEDSYKYSPVNLKLVN